MSNDPRKPQLPPPATVPVRVAVALEAVKALAGVPLLGTEAKAVYLAALAVVAEHLK